MPFVNFNNDNNKKIIFYFIFLSISIFASSCGKVLNSSSNDSALAQGTAEFVSAKQVLVAKCLSCHSNWSSYSESDFVTKGLVTKNSPVNSPLYTRIRGNDTPVNGDMPPGQPDIELSELSAIKTWISSIN